MPEQQEGLASQISPWNVQIRPVERKQASEWSRNLRMLTSRLWNAVRNKLDSTNRQVRAHLAALRATVLENGQVRLWWCSFYSFRGVRWMTYCSLYLRCSALFQAAVKKNQTNTGTCETPTTQKANLCYFCGAWHQLTCCTVRVMCTLKTSISI